MPLILNIDGNELKVYYNISISRSNRIINSSVKGNDIRRVNIRLNRTKTVDTSNQKPGFVVISKFHFERLAFLINNGNRLNHLERASFA